MPGRGKPFAKGRSGNPGGRPRSGLIDTIRDISNDGATIARFLHNVMQGSVPGAKPEDDPIVPRMADRVAASKVLLDAGFVRPERPVEISGTEAQPMVVQVVTLAGQPEEVKT